MQESPEADDCGKDCTCRTHLVNRRDFLALTGAAIASSLIARPVMAGPFSDVNSPSIIPIDKKLRPEWVRGLTARGAKTVYSKKRGELKYIGMPIGGICCGTVYLGGDGTLWNWDIFNENLEGVLPRNVAWKGLAGPKNLNVRDGASYVRPHTEKSPFEQGFALRVNDVVRPLNSNGWSSVEFQGEYPVGNVQYRDSSCPIELSLTSYSPFIPLDADDSGLPVVLCEFTLKNVSSVAVNAEIAGWLENAARVKSGPITPGKRVNMVRTAADATIVECLFASPVPPVPPPYNGPPDIMVEDFQRADYGRWVTTGTAFGKGPILRSKVPDYQGDLGGIGSYVVNSHASAPGKDSDSRDKATGTLTSPPFTIARKYLHFYIGGGSDIQKVGLAVLIDGKVERRIAGSDENHMHPASLDVGEFQGKQAVIQIYDNGTEGWGHIGVSHIIQTDSEALLPDSQSADASDGDNGTMALALLGVGVAKADADPVAIFDAPHSKTAEAGAESRLVAAITSAINLDPGQSHTVTYAIAWHFPNSKLKDKVKDAASGNYYAKRFADAAQVAGYVAREYPRLSRLTKLWRDTWRDSTLPHWFLGRSFANISTLATSTAHRFQTGRFWGWEGVGCCEGTCTHVWHYAQAMGRIFPALERDVRERVDFGLALNQKTGQIGFRGEGTGPAIDGQCGRILCAYREHQMSADSAFLHRIWPGLRKAIEFLIAHDSDSDGLIDGPQDNTLDGTWYGKIPWISSLYAAALRAGEEMARESGEADFASTCRAKFAVSKAAIEKQLFDEEYFIQVPDPKHKDSLGAYRGCHIDQVQGQSWAWQVGLGRILDPALTVSALKALYKYNFAPDVGPYREKHTEGRMFALAGDAGLIMITNPRGLADPFGNQTWQYEYFNECMSGFEHQAASHMIAEGLSQEGLAVIRAIDDRYHAASRNPYNEIECSDHYSRAMASYGSFITICGFEYHGPKGHIGFTPRITPDNFRAAFTAAEGWGTFSQTISHGLLEAQITVRHGRLALSTIKLSPPKSARSALAALGGSHLATSLENSSSGALVTLAEPLTVQAGQTLTLKLTF